MSPRKTKEDSRRFATIHLIPETQNPFPKSNILSVELPLAQNIPCHSFSISFTIRRRRDKSNTHHRPLNDTIMFHQEEEAEESCDKVSLTISFSLRAIVSHNLWQQRTFTRMSCCYLLPSSAGRWWCGVSSKYRRQTPRDRWLFCNNRFFPSSFDVGPASLRI